MKNRVSFLIGLLIFFISCFAVLILVSYAQTDVPEMINAHELIKKAFPNSKITWSEEIEGEMVNFRANSTALAILIANGDKRKIKFINFKDTTEWSIDCDKNSCRQYDLVGGDEPKLLIRGFENGMSKTKVINTQGEEIFDLNLKSWLSPSPSGKYYYVRGAMESYKQPEAYDSTGRLMWKREEYTGGEWFAMSLSDSELIYEDHTGLYLLDAFSGVEIWKISKSQYAQIVPGSKYFSPATNGEFFVLFNGRGLVSMDRQGEILWRKRSAYVVFYIDISHDGRFVSIYSRDSFESKENRLVFADNLDQGETIWSSSVKNERYEGTSNVGGLEISGDIVRLVPGIVDYRVQTGITREMQTLCYQIDSEAGKLLRQFNLPGVVEIIKDQSEIRNFLLLETTEKQIYGICKVRTE
jgi:outer membrane protein assembly factor BamB